MVIGFEIKNSDNYDNLTNLPFRLFYILLEISKDDFLRVKKRS